MTHLRLDKTPKLGVHQTGSSSFCTAHAKSGRSGEVAFPQAKTILKVPDVSCLGCRLAALVTKACIDELWAKG
jgi:hypothetical protein